MPNSAICSRRYFEERRRRYEIEPRRGEAKSRPRKEPTCARSASDGSEVLPSERNSNLLTSLKDIGRIFLTDMMQSTREGRTLRSGGLPMPMPPMPATEHEFSSASTPRSACRSVASTAPLMLKGVYHLALNAKGSLPFKKVYVVLILFVLVVRG